MLKSHLSVAAVFALFAVSARAEEDKYVKIVHAETQKVLAVAVNSEEARAKLHLAKDDGSEAQQWKVEKTGDILKLTNRKSGKVVDVFEASGDDGAEIIQWDAKDEDFDNQRWTWDGNGKQKRLKSKSSGKVLDVTEGGQAIQKASDDKAKSQLWEAVEVKK